MANARIAVIGIIERNLKGLNNMIKYKKRHKYKYTLYVKILILSFSSNTYIVVAYLYFNSSLGGATLCQLK